MIRSDHVTALKDWLVVEVAPRDLEKAVGVVGFTCHQLQGARHHYQSFRRHHGLDACLWTLSIGLVRIWARAGVLQKDYATC